MADLDNANKNVDANRPEKGPVVPNNNSALSAPPPAPSDAQPIHLADCTPAVWSYRSLDSRLTRIMITEANRLLAAGDANSIARATVCLRKVTKSADALSTHPSLRSMLDLHKLICVKKGHLNIDTPLSALKSAITNPENFLSKNTTCNCYTCSLATHPDSAIPLALLAYVGIAVASKQDAVEILQILAEKQSLLAAVELSIIYLNDDQFGTKQQAEALLLSAMEKHFPRAIFVRARMIEQGKATNFSGSTLEAALALYERAAQLGEPKAMYRAYLLSMQLKRNNAMHFLLDAAKLEDPNAVSVLADALLRGSTELGVNLNKAVELFELSARQGNLDAYITLYKLYQSGRGISIEADFHKVLGFALQGALDGEPSCQFFIGDYISADAVMLAETNAAESARLFANSVKWIVRAAKQDNPKAQLRLANAFYDGSMGLTQDLSKCLYWALKAADSDFVDAHLMMTHLCLKGIGRKKDTVEAITWCRKAARFGSPKAMHMLSLIHIADDAASFGLEVSQKKSDAFRRKAAASGHSEAMYLLGHQLLQSDLVENKEEGFAWVHRAATKGNVEAMFLLGQLYDEGVGAEVSTALAMYWLETAAKRGHKDAARMLSGALKNEDCALALRSVKSWALELRVRCPWMWL